MPTSAALIAEGFALYALASGMSTTFVFLGAVLNATVLAAAMLLTLLARFPTGRFRRTPA